MSEAIEVEATERKRRPDWLRVKLPTGENYRKILTAPKTARTIKPEAKAREAYEEHYARYTKIYPAIKEIYR